MNVKEVEGVEGLVERRWKKKPRGESGRILPCLIEVTELLKLQKSGQFPDEPERIKF